MSDRSEHNGRVFYPVKEACIPHQGASSMTGCMISGLAVEIGRAVGFESCWLLDGRIVGCQQDAIREECLS